MRIFPFLLLYFGVACNVKTGAVVKDTFVNDNKTRRNSTAEESAYVVAFGELFRCAGILLNAKTVLTAAHVPDKEGSIQIGNLRRDFRITEPPLEISPRGQYDYAIYEVTWLPPAQKEYDLPPSKVRGAPALLINNTLRYGPDSNADMMYTIGFPIDMVTTVPVTAFGFAKDFVKIPSSSGFVRFNIGAAPGNSGGPVFLKKSLTLVSIVTNGPHRDVNDPGFRNKSLEDPEAWNWGPALFEVYPNSPVLQRIFPNGTNKYTNHKGAFYRKGNCYTDVSGQEKYLCE